MTIKFPLEMELGLVNSSKRNFALKMAADTREQDFSLYTFSLLIFLFVHLLMYIMKTFRHT